MDGEDIPRQLIKQTFQLRECVLDFGQRHSIVDVKLSGSISGIMRYCVMPPVFQLLEGGVFLR